MNCHEPAMPLTTHESTYHGFHDAITQELKRASPDHVDRYLAWSSWRPNRPAPYAWKSDGAGQYRAIGRVCASKSLRDVDQALTRAWDKANGAAGVTATAARAAARRTEDFGGRRCQAVIFVIGSVSGGSAPACSSTSATSSRRGTPKINGMLFTPEVFEKPTGETEPGWHRTPSWR